MEANASKETDGQLKKNTSVPEGLKTLSILSMVGSGLLTLIYLGLGLFIGEDEAFFSFLFMAISIPFALKFVGALKMYKGQKSGYKIYMIPSIILNLLLGTSIVFGYQSGQIVGATILTGLMIVFAIIFYNYKGQLK